MKYKFELQKGSNHVVCPNCGKKTFKPFVESGTNNVVDAFRFGRCERINNCQYFLYPKTDSEWTPPPLKYIAKPPTDFIPFEIVERSFSNFNNNPFYLWLCKIFDAETAFNLQKKYNIGTARNFGTIFWQKDKDSKFRTGKVFYYQNNGKRDKERASWYVHNRVKENFQLNQVFFGEHLIDENKPVALCESEKTAICMSVFEPKYTWVASGGAMMLNNERLIRLNRIDKVYPDQGEQQNWTERTKTFNRKVDTSVERAFKNGELEKGADILDLILKNKGIYE